MKTATNAFANAIEVPSAKPAWVPGRRFAPVLSVAVLTTRWLATYATPCHSQGRAF